MTQKVDFLGELDTQIVDTLIDHDEGGFWFCDSCDAVHCDLTPETAKKRYTEAREIQASIGDPTEYPEFPWEDVDEADLLPRNSIPTVKEVLAVIEDAADSPFDKLDVPGALPDYAEQSAPWFSPVFESPGSKLDDELIAIKERIYNLEQLATELTDGDALNRNAEIQRLVDIAVEELDIPDEFDIRDHEDAIHDIVYDNVRDSIQDHLYDSDYLNEEQVRDLICAIGSEYANDVVAALTFNVEVENGLN